MTSTINHVPSQMAAKKLGRETATYFTLVRFGAGAS